MRRSLDHSRVPSSFCVDQWVIVIAGGVRNAANSRSFLEVGLTYCSTIFVHLTLHRV